MLPRQYIKVGLPRYWRSRGTVKIKDRIWNCHCKMDLIQQDDIVRKEREYM